MERLDRKTFDYLVELAALALEKEEADYIFAEMNKQIQTIEELLAIPIPEDSWQALHGVSFTPENSPELRQDVHTEFDDRQGLASQVPNWRDGYIYVPETTHTTLG